MSQPNKPTPRGNLEGIDDRSRRALPVEPEQIPQHLPYAYLFTERGPAEPMLVSGDSMLSVYGDRSFDYLGPYANHQTVMAKRVNGKANALFIQRLKPADAATSMLRLSLEVLKEVLPVYERVAGTGEILTDENGPVQALDGNSVPITTIGYKVRWLLGTTDAPGTFGQASVGNGDLGTEQPSSLTGEDSTVYPIMDLMVASWGEYGDRMGLRLSAPHANVAIPGDTDLMRSLGAFLYRFQFIERPIDAATPNIIRNNFNATSMDLAFARDLIHPTLGTELSVEDSLIQNYEQKDTPGVTPKDGPFGDMHLYYANLELVLDMLVDGDSENGNVAAGEASFDAEAAQYGRTSALAFGGGDKNHLLNIVSGKDTNGVPYFNFVVLGAADGGVYLSENTNHYASGGADGDISLGNFDKLVRNETTYFGDLEFPLLDMAKYPMSIFYDTGFSLDTKEALLTPIGRRKDVAVVLSTQELGRWQDDGAGGEEWVTVAPNDQQTETTMAATLQTAAETYPESVIHGTSVCRAIVIGHCGRLINSQYKGYLPLTIDFAEKAADYMGASNGRWKKEQAFDDSPLNRVEIFRDVNLTYKPDTVQDMDWAAGVCEVRWYDRQRLFYPGFQTVYSDDTSVLNSAVTMLACVELEKVCMRAWRELTGNSSLTDEQFVERSDALIEQYTEGRFAGRFVIQPETIFTPNDQIRGFSWHAKAKIFANNMRTVGTMTIEAYRMSDLDA